MRFNKEKKEMLIKKYIPIYLISTPDSILLFFCPYFHISIFQLIVKLYILKRHFSLWGHLSFSLRNERANRKWHRVTQFFLHSSIHKNFSCVSLCLVQSTPTSYQRDCKHPCCAAPSLPQSKLKRSYQ